MEKISCSNVLIVDDSIVVLNMLEKGLNKHLSGVNLYKALNYAEAEELTQSVYFQAAIVDVTLPDAHDGAAIDLTLAHGIPTIVLTGTTDSELKEFLLSKNISDLILKNNANNITYAIFAVRRILKNYSTQVLVVDDSNSMRHMLSRLLKRLHLNVFEANDPIEALEILNDKNNHISMVITDYEMPRMNGLEFTLMLRQKYRKDILSIIALSAVDEKGLSTKFLKHGANDFLQKPFDPDELYVRINTHLELLAMFENHRDSQGKDPICGLLTKTPFLQQTQQLIDEANRNDQFLTFALIEIDRSTMNLENYLYKSDTIIQKVSETLEGVFPYPTVLGKISDTLFGLVDIDIPYPQLIQQMDHARHLIESTHIEFHHEILVVTISVGVHTGNKTSLSEFYQIAKRNLEISQQTGHNKMTSTHVNLDDILDDSDSMFALIGESNTDDSYDLLEELN